MLTNVRAAEKWMTKRRRKRKERRRRSPLFRRTSIIAALTLHQQTNRIEMTSWEPIAEATAAAAAAIVKSPVISAKTMKKTTMKTTHAGIVTVAAAWVAAETEVITAAIRTRQWIWDCVRLSIRKTKKIMMMTMTTKRKCLTMSLVSKWKRGCFFGSNNNRATTNCPFLVHLPFHPFHPFQRMDSSSDQIDWPRRPSTSLDPDSNRRTKLLPPLATMRKQQWENYLEFTDFNVTLLLRLRLRLRLLLLHLIRPLRVSLDYSSDDSNLVCFRIIMLVHKKTWS